jgi:integrase
MSRPRKSARLWLRPARKGRAEIFVILDGGKEVSTGCGKGDLEGAERAFETYLKNKHDPKAGRGGDPNAVKVADAISFYATEHVVTLARPKAILKRLDNVLEFFGLNVVGELDGELQRKYVTHRGIESSARRELEDLAAAINFYLRDKVGGAIQQFRPVLPDPPEARDRWLSRDEAAHLIRTAWRARKQNRGGSLGPSIGKHVARFILVGLYTGTRSGAICGAALMPTIGRGYVDLDRGIFNRKRLGVKETNKRQPTVDIHPRLLAHMRRWQRLGISNHSVIEWQGKPVLRVTKAFESIRTTAKLPDVSPHTLRHTAISWMLRAGIAVSDVSDYCGVSETIIRGHYKHHMPGTFDRVFEAMPRFGRTERA